jgi:hypothetical protein
MARQQIGKEKNVHPRIIIFCRDDRGEKRFNRKIYSRGANETPNATSVTYLSDDEY